MSSFCDLDTIVTSAAALLFTAERLDIVKISGVIDLQITGTRVDDDVRAFIFMSFVEGLQEVVELTLTVQAECPLHFCIQYTQKQDLLIDVGKRVFYTIATLIHNLDEQIKHAQQELTQDKNKLKGLQSVLAHFK